MSTVTTALQHPVLRRVLTSVIALWAAYTLTFLIVSALPGDPVSILLSASDTAAASQEEIDALRAQYGLDKPLWVQYFVTLGHLLTGDLGTSYTTGQPVTAMLAEVLPSTLQLAALALLLALAGGLGTAIAAVGTRSPWLRNVLASLPGVGVSMPTFWVGLILLQVFSFQLGWIPALGGRGLAAVILPALTLSLPLGAMIAQVVCKALEAAWRQQFVTTYTAAGLRQWTVLMTHALPASATALLSVSGLVIGQLLGGAVVVETVFTRNGMGRLAETAVSSQDVPVVQGIVIVSAAVFILVNLITDLLYPIVDPRSRVAPKSRAAQPAAVLASETAAPETADGTKGGSAAGFAKGSATARSAPERSAAHVTERSAL